jgi:ABC-type transport system involved in Fe-S cluster assembly fused permease/ATPase subunit
MKVNTTLQFVFREFARDISTPARMRLVLCVLALLLAKATLIATAFLYQHLVMDLSLPRIVLSLATLLIVLYGLNQWLSSFFQEAKDILFKPLASNISMTIFKKLHSHIYQLGHAYHANQEAGVLTQIIMRGVSAIETILSQSIFYIAPLFLEVGAILVIVGLHFGVLDAGLILLGVSVYTLFTLWMTDKMKDMQERVNALQGKSYHILFEGLNQFETVDLFQGATHESARLMESVDEAQDVQLTLKKMQSQNLLGRLALLLLTFMVVMAHVAHAMSLQQANLGDFILMNILLMQLYQPIAMSGNVYQSMKQGMVDLEGIYKLMCLPAVKSSSTHKGSFKGDIHFKEVSFAYPDGARVIEHFNLHIAAGESIALLGRSGEGKSTLMKLLLQWYVPSSGAIYLDHTPIHTLAPEFLKEKIGLVTQDTILFNESIYYNITYGKPHATLDAIIEVARLAELHDFIETLPEGYDTRVGTRGLKLSGGQKQRICIARMLLRKPDIFIFDEATSALDPNTENEILRTLKKITQGKTAIFITHRDSIRAFVDRSVSLSALSIPQHFSKSIEEAA